MLSTEPHPRYLSVSGHGVLNLPKSRYVFGGYTPLIFPGIYSKTWPLLEGCIVPILRS